MISQPNDLRVLLIGGPPGAGKTTLARSVSGRLGFASTTVDDLVTTARLTTTRASHPDLHQVAGDGHLPYFTNGPPERLIADAKRLDRAMWPIVEHVIRRHVASDAPVVLDWWLFSPEKVAPIADRRVKSVWLHIDAEALDVRERANTEFRDGSSDPDRMHSNFMARSLWRNEFVATQAAALDLPVLYQPGGRTVKDLTNATISALGVESDPPWTGPSQDDSGSAPTED